MLTKYRLFINGAPRDLGPDSIRNWSDIKCSYRRDGLSGAVRSFSSAFEFVGEARDLLLAEYLANGLKSTARIEILALCDDWSYETLFSCGLDFSSVKIERGVFSINALDGGASAVIKANKSTKYELVIGEDIKPDGKMRFPRLPMRESVTYELTDGNSRPDGSLNISYSNSMSESGNIWLGNVGFELPIGGTALYEDDQTYDTGSYLFKALRSVCVHCSATVTYDALTASGLMTLSLAGGGHTPTIGMIGSLSKTMEGEYATAEALLDAMPVPSAESYAIVGGIVWDAEYKGYGYEWKSTEQTLAEYSQRTVAFETDIDLSNGETVRVKANSPSGFSGRILSSKFEFSWTAIGETVSIDCFKPKTIASTILGKMFEGSGIAPAVSISGADERISGTAVIAGESIRGIDNAKLYASFAEVCDWLSAVYGYACSARVLTAEEYFRGTIYERLKREETAGAFVTGTVPYLNEHIGEDDDSNVVYMRGYNRFMYRKSSDGSTLYYASWYGVTRYNKGGKPRTDTVFTIGGGRYYFEDGIESPIPYTPSDVPLDAETVAAIEFMPYGEMFREDAPVKAIADAVDVIYSIDPSDVYASVETGYDKQDYDSANGRDEFNFGISYATGQLYSDKKLSLMSKFRADGYGIEFAAQSRGKSTTDKGSDKSVFFVYCSVDGDAYAPLMPDSGPYAVSGTLSGLAVNGAFTPAECAKANAAVICQQGDVTLSFASSTGNSDVTVAGHKLSEDITLERGSITAGRITFTTADLDMPDVGDIVEIESDGVIYRGYIAEMTFGIGREESAEYKLIVKEMLNDF